MPRGVCLACPGTVSVNASSCFAGLGGLDDIGFVPSDQMSDGQRATQGWVPVYLRMACGLQLFDFGSTQATQNQHIATWATRSAFAEPQHEMTKS